MIEFLDLIGKKFGKLTVIKLIRKPRYSGGGTWECLCECGKSKVYYASQLLGNDYKSCGCSQFKGYPAHGKNGIPEHKVWQSMVGRCESPSNPNKHRYAERGITVCERWRNSFNSFYEDMGPRPTSKHTLERIDNDKGYEPGNCKWATRKEQGRNRSTCHYLEFQGEKLSVVEWAERIGVKPETLHGRLRNGWSVEKALTTPLDLEASRRRYSKKR